MTAQYTSLKDILYEPGTPVGIYATLKKVTSQIFQGHYQILYLMDLS